MSFFKTANILFLILFTSCQHAKKHESLQNTSPIQKYNLTINNILIENNNIIENIIDINITDRLRKYISKEKFFSTQGNNILKIIIKKANILINNLSIPNTYNIDLLVKFEAYDEEDILFPSVESEYYINETIDIDFETSKNSKLKSIDSIIDLAISKLDMKIDQSFKENFYNIIETD